MTAADGKRSSPEQAAKVAALIKAFKAVAISEAIVNFDDGLAAMGRNDATHRKPIEAAVRTVLKEAFAAEDGDLITLTGDLAAVSAVNVSLSFDEWGDLLCSVAAGIIPARMRIRERGNAPAGEALEVLVDQMAAALQWYPAKDRADEALRAASTRRLKAQGIDPTTTINVLVIPADDDLPMRAVTVEHSWAALYNLVGGTVDMIDLQGTDCAMFVDGNGKLPPQKEPNRRARNLVNSLVRKSTPPEILNGPLGEFALVDWVAGDAVVYGEPSDGQERPRDAGLSFLALHGQK